MTVPDWRTSSAGSRVRVALWLREVVGVEGVFTKAQLRAAFPRIEQVDRRMRELRRDGWVMATYREDRSLIVDELRLLRIGDPVWEVGYRSKREDGVSDKERRRTLAADNYICVLCGIMGGEAYPDDHLRTAKLLVTSTSPTSGGQRQLMTSCDRCQVGDDERGVGSTGSVLALFESLTARERANFVRWASVGRRELSPDQVLWVAYSQLQASERKAVLNELSKVPVIPT